MKEARRRPAISASDPEALTQLGMLMARHTPQTVALCVVFVSVEPGVGVLGALEVVRSLNDLKIETRRPIVVVNWTNEEGSRFAPAMVSSGVFAGVFPKEFAYSRVDADGKTLGGDLERVGDLAKNADLSRFIL